MADIVDVVVVGMGPGGEEVAGRLAESGLSVVGVEAGLLGGECPYWGCVPSKMMIRAANALAEARRVPILSGAVEVRPDWAPVARRIREEATDDWDDTVAVERFVGRGGRFVRGRGRLLANDRVAVGDEVFEARRAIVVATGAQSVAPPVPGLAEVPFWTNREAIEAEVLPASLTVIGGGSIGVELGQVFARFGTEVHIVEAADRLLALEEPEASELVARALVEDRAALHTSAEIARVDHDGARFRVELGADGAVTSERLLVATGRRPDLAALGVEAIGCDPSAGALRTDEHQRVTEGVWAVGDVTGAGAFTHVSMYQAAIAIADILGDEHDGASYRALPRVTFTDPEIGAVGLTEAAAQGAGIDVQVATSPIPASARGWIHKAGNAGIIKLVADADRNVLVGATSAGPMGGEVLGMLVLAVHAEVRLEVLSSMIYAYPTFHRAIEPALAELAGTAGA